jgi:predicted nucleotidyltransferase
MNIENPVLDKFNPPLRKFFFDLQNYVEEDLHFYGSVTRSDYVPYESDIDIAIFTDNEKSTLTKLQHFLHIKRSAFDKLVWKLEGKMIYGYKLKCDKYVEFPHGANKCEIAVYNKDFQDILMKEIETQNVIPFYISILLFILKSLYYKLRILPESVYVKYKRYIFNTLFKQQTNSVFHLLKQT